MGISSLWILLGIKLKKNTENVTTIKSFKKVIIVAILPFAISIIVIVLFKTIILHNQPIPARAYTFSSFALAGFCSVLFFLIGFYKTIPFLLYRYALLIIPAIVFIFLSLNLVTQFGYAKNYANKYDQLILQFSKLAESGNKESISVTDLPDSGTLLQLNLTDSYYTVNPLKEILGVHFDIQLKE